METKWTEAIHTTPQPETGTLTERALSQVPIKAHRGLRPYAYGSLALAATLPIALLILPKINMPTEREPLPKQVKAMPEKVMALPENIQAASRQHSVSPELDKPMKPSLSASLGFGKAKPLRERQVAEERVRLQEKTLAESSPTTFGFQEREVVKEEALLRLARGGIVSKDLSALSPSSNARGVQLAFAMRERLGELEGTPLTPLPNAPTDENPQLKTSLTRWPDGNVEGTLALGAPSRGGLNPKTYLVYVAAFDAKGTLVSTAQTELPGAGGTATVRLGLAPTAQHYQLALFAKPALPKDEQIVAGWWVQHLEGKVPPPLTGTYGESTYNLVTLAEPHFIQNNYYKTVSANLSVSVASLSDAAGYRIHGALFDEKRMLLSTDQAPLKPLKLTVGTPLQAQHSQEISLGFGVTGQHAARYQLAVTAPAPLKPNFRLEESLVAQAVKTEKSLALKPQTAQGGIALSLSALSETASKAPDASFVVASATTEADGSLLLMPPQNTRPMEEVFKNPKLRDYTQIKLTPSVVAALKAKGITEFVGKSVQASGKSQTSLYLSRPAFEVTTITVQTAEDIFVAPPQSAGLLEVASVKTEADGSLLLLPKLNQHPMEDVMKNPKLRDYTQVKLTPAVVAALKAKGITEFVGKSIQASGKSQTSLYLSFPAFEVTTVTVEKAEDLQVVELLRGN